VEHTNQTIATWSLLKKLLFCFFFIFFLLYIFLNPNDIIPYSYYIHKLYSTPCNALITWLAKDVFHIVGPAIRFYNGTIDTVFGYVTVLFIFLAALFGSVIWVAVDRKTNSYPKLYKALIWILRYYLAISWLAYGSIKIARLQFPPLSPDVLLQTYGNSTPKGLAWAFMGYSAGYNYFLGTTEIVVGLLLFFRRTSGLGNIIALGILANVMAFNYSFDVNVKLVATMLMVMTLFLLSKDIGRLTDFFFLNNTIAPVDEKQAYFKDKWKNTAIRLTKYAFIVFILFFDLHGYFARAKQFDAQRKKPPLFGVYLVTTFIRNNDTVKPLPTDKNCWSKLIISVPEGNAGVVMTSDSLKYFVLQMDTAQKKMSLSAKTDTADHYTFHYSHSKHSLLLLKGKWRDDSLEIYLREYDMNKFPLLNRKFRWIIDHNAGYKN
jgi:hypothetical protein